LDITNQEQLREAEGALGLLAMPRIITGQMPLPGNFDAAHIKQIHQETFKDVYDWASQTRANGPAGYFKARSRPPFAGRKTSCVTH
jgi:cell filamentation protein